MLVHLYDKSEIPRLSITTMLITLAQATRTHILGNRKVQYKRQIHQKRLNKLLTEAQQNILATILIQFVQYKMHN